MLKEKQSIADILNRFVVGLRDFNTDGKILFCKYCAVPVTVVRRFQVTHRQAGI